MAGGTAVLGSVMAGPVLLVMGYLAAGKSEEALTKALTHSAEIDKAVEQLASMSVALDAIDTRTDSCRVLQTLDERFQAAASIVFLAWLAEYVVIVRRFIWMKVVRCKKASQHRIEYVKLSDKDQSSFNVMISWAQLFTVSPKLKFWTK